MKLTTSRIGPLVLGGPRRETRAVDVPAGHTGKFELKFDFIVLDSPPTNGAWHARSCSTPDPLGLSAGHLSSQDCGASLRP
jgi:hypothetical protein